MSIGAGLLSGLGGGAIGSAVVRLALDTTTYNGQLAAAEGKTEAATTTMSGSTAKASGAMIGLYAAAGAAAVSFGAAAVQSASEHEQVMAALTAAVGEDTQAFEEQATALQNLSGFQDEAILSADTLLSRFNLTDQQVRDAIPTILDYARATGKDVPESAQLIGKALLGNARALKTVGINYTATGDTATDYATILDDLNQKVGGQAAAYAETYAGKLEILSARFDDLKEVVGGELIESLSELADDLNILIAAGEKLGEALPVDAIGGWADAVTNTINPIHLITEGLGYLDEKFHLTDEGAAELTDSLTRTASGVVILDEAATHVDPSITAMQESLSGLKDATQTAGEGILTLEGTVKETFDVTQKEMDKGFEEMLQIAVRFKKDISALEALDLHLSPKAELEFETMLASDLGQLDRFVNSSKAKQAQWVAEWRKSQDAVKAGFREIDNISVSPTVDTSSLSLAAARASNLQDKLKALGGY